MKMKKRVTPLSTELFSDSEDSDNAKYVLCIFEVVNYRYLKCILKVSSGKTVFPFRNNEVVEVRCSLAGFAYSLVIEICTCLFSTQSNYSDYTHCDVENMT